MLSTIFWKIAPRLPWPKVPLGTYLMKSFNVYFSSLLLGNKQ